MTDQHRQITYLAMQVEALKTVIVMLDDALRVRDLDCPTIMNEAFDHAVTVIETRRQTPARDRALAVIKEMQLYLGADGPVSAATRKTDI